jgi:hypothetical protein
MKSKKRKAGIHASIKKQLGYRADESDRDVLKDWRRRTSRVCKPCWELKYCPYGPLVEQSPTLPQDRSSAIEHNEYLQQAVATGKTGSIDKIDDEERKSLKRILADDDMLLRRALHEVRNNLEIQAWEESENPLAAFVERFTGDLPPIEQYRVSFEVMSDSPIDPASFEPEFKKKIDEAIADDRRCLERAIATGLHDLTSPLDRIRRAWFQAQIDSFDAESYPEEVPPIFEEAVCNIFGHICPVFFTAETLSETEEARRRGRYIPFKTKIRVVRRDNYTCQHCGTHLRDDAVEFDHIIPVSRGGSSEEHNIRLTCFECNRDKSDNVTL